MFKNSGSKVRVIARVLLIVQTIACIAAAIYFFTREEPEITTGILLIVGGFFAAWFEAVSLYAVGVSAEAAEHAEENNKSVTQRLDTLERKMDLYFVETLPAPASAEEKEKKEKKSKDKKK